MKFYFGMAFGPRRRRGRGRGTYQMSRAAYQARRSNLVRVTRRRTYAETRRLELDIALASHEGEPCRSTARRLGCSHVHCWRTTRRYRRGLLRPVPRDKQELIAFRDSLYGDVRPEPPAQILPELRPEPPAYVIPELYRDLEKWKDEYYAERPWLRGLRTT